MIQLFNFETKTNTSSTFTRLLLQTIRLFHLSDECWLLSSNSFRIAIWICHHNMNVIKLHSVSNPSYLSKERALEKRFSVIAPKILLPHGGEPPSHGQNYLCDPSSCVTFRRIPLPLTAGELTEFLSCSFMLQRLAPLICRLTLSLKKNGAFAV